MKKIIYCKLVFPPKRGYKYSSDYQVYPKIDFHLAWAVTLLQV